MLVTEPSAKYVVRSIDHATSQMWITCRGDKCVNWMEWKKNRIRAPVTLNTAISPDVECGDPKWTPDTSSSVSLWLNCENWVYFQLNFFISCEYLTVAGYDEFQICLRSEYDKSMSIAIPFKLKCIQSHQNVSILGARCEHASIVWETDVQHLMWMGVLQFIRQHHRYIVSQSFVFIEPRFGTCKHEVKINKWNNYCEFAINGGNGAFGQQQKRQSFLANNKRYR